MCWGAEAQKCLEFFTCRLYYLSDMTCEPFVLLLKTGTKKWDCERPLILQVHYFNGVLACAKPIKLKEKKRMQQISFGHEFRSNGPLILALLWDRSLQFKLSSFPVRAHIFELVPSIDCKVGWYYLQFNMELVDDLIVNITPVFQCIYLHYMHHVWS